MTQSLWIPIVFPGMNEIVDAAKSGHGRGNGYSRLKAQWGGVVWSYAKSVRLHPAARAGVAFEWREKDRRRDLDNIAAASKFILDGLVKAKVLPGDGWRHVIGLEHRFTVDAQKPGVLVTIVEA